MKQKLLHKKAPRKIAPFIPLVIVLIIILFPVVDIIRSFPIDDRVQYIGKNSRGMGTFLILPSFSYTYYYGTNMTPVQVAEHFKKARLKDKIDTNQNEFRFTLLTDKGEVIHVLMYEDDHSSQMKEEFKSTTNKYTLVIPDDQYPVLKNSL